MKINEVLDVVEYGIKYYRNPKTGNKMNLMEYYSFTDLSPKELGKVALSNKRAMLNLALINMHDKCYWQLKPLDMSARLRLFHSIKGRELTADDKLTIRDKLQQEGFPLVDGVYDIAARYYVEGGVDSISKENIRNAVILSYNKAHNLEENTIGVSQEKGAILVK